MRRQTSSTQSGVHLFGAIIVIIGVMSAHAAASGALSQGFPASDTSLMPGTLVSLQATASGTTVKKATSDHAAQLVGVVANKPLVALDDTNNQQLQVVTSGVTPAVVSDINGSVKAGDKITASPLEGIGMKALTSSEVIGTAESNLSNSKTTAKTITDINGKASVVHIGTISVQVGVTYYIVPRDGLSSIIPAPLINLANSIAGKDLSAMRVLIGFSTLLAGFLIAGIMLQTAVRSGIISLGRNPLAHGILRQGLIDVFVTSVVILLITIAVFYLILKI
jgi:hypothetical protein